MPVGVIQLGGCITGIVGSALIVVTTFLPEWKVSDSSGDSLDSIVHQQGLWVKCATYTTGQWNCESFDSFFLGLPSSLQAARGLSCSALVFACFALQSSFIGMECTTCLSTYAKVKSKIALIAGSFWIAAGGCIGAAVSFYSKEVLSDYNRSLTYENFGQKYIYGTSLFVGWAAFIMCLISGLLLVCGSRCSEQENSRRTCYRPAYDISNKSQKLPFNTEYV